MGSNTINKLMKENTMIDFKYVADKSVVKAGEQKKTVLFQIEGKKVAKKAKERMPLNISIVIDISGSMGDRVTTNETVKRVEKRPKLVHPSKLNPVFDPNKYPEFNPNKIFGNVWIDKPGHHYEYEEVEVSYPVYSTKMEQAKKAAKKALTFLREEDFVSIVLFDSNVHILQKSIQATPGNVLKINGLIDTIQPNSSTNLHEGWVAGSTEVAKKLSEKKINRVLLLTDGEVNVGVTNHDQICSNVSKLYEKGVSLSTFGIGDRFQEDLLQAMANSGGGNSYYINDKADLSSMFEDEFNGLSNLVGENLTLTFDLPQGVSVKEDLNKFNVVDNAYKLTNIINHQVINAMFVFDVNVAESSGKFNFGVARLSYKDDEGQNKSIEFGISFDIVSDKAFDDAQNNEEVKVQEALLVIANNKIVANRYIDEGNMDMAKKILRDSSVYATSMGNDPRLLDESANLVGSLSASESMSAMAFRKDLSYQSYNVRNGKMSGKGKDKN